MLIKKSAESIIMKYKNRKDGIVADQLSKKAEMIQSEQEQLLDSAAIEQLYDSALSMFVMEKHSQVDRIEDRLETLIFRNESRLSQHLNNKPSFISRPSTKNLWEKKKLQLRTTIKMMKQRLHKVSVIKEGMGLFSTKIEELATRKLRAANPELSSSWSAMRESKRKLSINRINNITTKKSFTLSQSLNHIDSNRAY